jgi:hypothetical protein
LPPLSFTQTPEDLLALDDALTRFAAEEPAKAELVKLRFFAGLSTPEAASAWASRSHRPSAGGLMPERGCLVSLKEEADHGILPNP